MADPTNEQLIGQIDMGAGTFAARTAEIARSYMAADQEAQIAHVAYMQGVAKLPNIVVEQEEELGFGLGKISRRDERAAVTAVHADRFGMEDAEVTFAMTVGSHTEASKETDVNVKSETTASAGGGGFLVPKVNVKTTLSAEVRHNSKNTRTTDMSAELNCRMKMGRVAAPEGLIAMQDTANEFSRASNKLRMDIATAVLAGVKQRIIDGDIDPLALVQAGNAASGGDAPASAAPASGDAGTE